MKNSILSLITLGISSIIFSACGGDNSTNNTTLSNANVPTAINTKEELGQSLFFDITLSLNRTMSCATCHNPQQAFIDTRNNGVNGSVSMGDDGSSLGDRNAPMLSYTSFTPNFNLENLTGGQFLDGRSANLIEQAKRPFLNPVEMQMPDAQSVITRVRENNTYITAIESIYGENIFDNIDTAYTAIADAIASFEQTSIFQTFDSDFDNNTMSQAAIRGQNLFRSRRINCVRCHNDRGNALFSNFTYENLGIPTNTAVRNLNGHGIDHGLLENPNVSSQNENGKFKVAGLRNVAVTAPYMHNGIFKTLKTVVHFYNTRDVAGAINPDTGATWSHAEVTDPNIVRNGIGNLGLSDAEENDIVSFLEALTDVKYKSLIP